MKKILLTLLTCSAGVLPVVSISCSKSKNRSDSYADWDYGARGRSEIDLTSSSLNLYSVNIYI